MNISVDTETLRVADEGAAMLQRVEALHPLLRLIPLLEQAPPPPQWGPGGG